MLVTAVSPVCPHNENGGEDVPHEILRYSKMIHF